MRMVFTGVEFIQFVSAGLNSYITYMPEKAKNPKGDHCTVALN